MLLHRLVTKSALQRMSSDGSASEKKLKATKIKVKKAHKLKNSDKGEVPTKKRKTTDAELGEDGTSSAGKSKKPKKVKSKSE